MKCDICNGEILQLCNLVSRGLRCSNWRIFPRRLGLFQGSANASTSRRYGRGRDIPRRYGKNALALLSTKYEENCQKTAAIHDEMLLEHEMSNFVNKLLKISRKTSAEQWKQFSQVHGTAIFGSSIIRDIDRNKLVTTKCVSISGGLIKDLHTEVDNFLPHRKLSRAVLVIGGNDCDNNGAGSDVTDMLNQCKDLINNTKFIANSITVSSICLWNRSTENTERISSLNAGLQALCSYLEIGYTEHNPPFHL